MFPSTLPFFFLIPTSTLKINVRLRHRALAGVPCPLLGKDHPVEAHHLERTIKNAPAPMPRLRPRPAVGFRRWEARE